MNEQGMSAVPQALAANLTRLVSPARLQSLATLPGPLAQEPAEDGHMFGRAGSPPGRNRPIRLADTVQQLAIHTQGGVVTEAQPLMVIVPSDAPVEVEAMLENKDIGFVRPGQEVEIKVETFTFTKYGVVQGVVTSISNDAIEDEKLGLVYSARIQLEENRIRVGDQDIALSPGMAVRAEVKTDKRMVIDYFLSPLREYASDSLEGRQLYGRNIIHKCI